MTKNLLDGELKIGVKPKMLDLIVKRGGKPSNRMVMRVIDTLEVIDTTKSIQLTTKELGISVVSFKQTLKRLAEKLDLRYWVKVWYDKDDDVVHIFKVTKVPTDK